MRFNNLVCAVIKTSNPLLFQGAVSDQIGTTSKEHYVTLSGHDQLLRAPPSCRSESGNQNVTVVPSPFVPSMVNFPPCIKAINEASANPCPELFNISPSLGRRGVNGARAGAVICSFIPTPLSWIEITIHGATWRMAILTSEA